MLTVQGYAVFREEAPEPGMIIEYSMSFQVLPCHEQSSASEIASVMPMVAVFVRATFSTCLLATCLKRQHSADLNHPHGTS